MPKSKPFVIATEGATTDGRNISAEWIKQMAESYDPKSYTALGNLEHYISMLPSSDFSAYGKVLALSTQTGKVLGENKLQLLAEFDANDAIVALQKSGKKMFASIEVNPDFAKTGKAYLQGIAFTDTPASLGTEVMQFAAKAKENPFDGRKKEAGNLFSVAEEISIEWVPESDTEKPGAGDNLFAKVKEVLGLGKKDTDARFSDQAEAITAVAESQKDLLDRFAANEKASTAAADALKKISDDFAAISEKFEKLTTDFNTKPDGTPTRPAATGGNGNKTTDC